MPPTTNLTVAIPYVNADPHLGYAYELVLADIHARARRQLGHDVRFLGGTDDNSLKNVLAAERAGADVRSFVAGNAERFAALGRRLQVSFDDFICTSADARHAPAVAELWARVARQGDLYRDRYSGPYCVDCEDFYAADDLVAGTRCPEHLVDVEVVDEQNWFFALSRYAEQVEDLLATDALEIRPAPFRTEALAFVRRGLRDLSVSRSVGRARGWGLAVPGDPGQVVYVWFDALVNYLSALEFGSAGAGQFGRWWVDAEERIHVVGKGILRFHAVYWPAFLLSAGLPLPTRIQVHPYLTAAGHKLSKSAPSGGLTPDDAIARVGVDGLRWWFARDVAEVVDTDVTTERLVSVVNADLANNIGNLVHRVVSLVHRWGVGHPRAGIGASAPTALGPDLEGLPAAVAEALVDFRPRRAAGLVIEAASALNRHIEAEAPWRWADRADRADERDALLGGLLVGVSHLGQALRPLVPDLAARIDAQVLTRGGPQPSPEPVFARIG